MTRHTGRNLRIKRKYLLWLKEAKGCSTATVDRAAASIDRYEAFVRGADFGQFHIEKARAFKRHLDASRHPATGRPLAAGTIDGTLRDLKGFFSWLADQDGYRTGVRHSDAAYFSPSRRMAKAAHGSTWRPHPTPHDIRHALRVMPAETVVERRNRAVLAGLFVTGARDGSLITLRLRHLDVRAECVHFAGAGVETKFGKVFTAWFFPVGEEVVQVLTDWISELRHGLGRGPDDAVFPKERTGRGEAGGFTSLGLDRAGWSSAAPVAAICKQAFTAAGLPPFTPHLIRKTLVDLASDHCDGPEDFKAWSQNLAHEDVLTTFRSYGAVGAGRQGELFARMREKLRDRREG